MAVARGVKRPDPRSVVKPALRTADACNVNTGKVTESKRAHLRLVGGVHAGDALPLLEREVRSVRRDMARLLRALQASGETITSWGLDVVTRLAHLDAVTARYLLDGRGEADVRQASQGLRAIETWILDGLTRAQRAEVRGFELVIRIEDAELTRPLFQPGEAPETNAPSVALGHTMPPRSLRTGLRGLEDEELAALGRRLGVRPLDIEHTDSSKAREHLESTILDLLHDDHLLAILLCTIDDDAKQLLADLIRGFYGRREIEDLARPAELAQAVGADATTAPTAVGALSACGLLFRSRHADGPPLWVPVELQPRIDGILRGLGL